MVSMDLWLCWFVVLHGGFLGGPNLGFLWRGSWWFLVVMLVVVLGGAAHGGWCCF